MQHSSLLRIFRLLRLTRVARLARITRQIPELAILVKGLIMALRSVFSTLCLLLLIVYVFAVLFTQLLKGTNVGKGCFENVPQSMNCLLLDGVFADQADFINKLLKYGLLYYFLILVYLVLGSLTVLNMLIGVICEVLSVTAQAEREENLLHRVKEKLLQGLPELNNGTNTIISKSQLSTLLECPAAIRTLREVDVDVFALVDHAEFIFRDAEELDFEILLEMVLQFRGSNAVTLKDVAELRQHFSHEILELEARLSMQSHEAH